MEAAKQLSPEEAARWVEEHAKELTGQVRVPGPEDRVYKDECVFSHDSPFSPEGLYVSLSSFRGFSRRHVLLDHQRSGRQHSVYLHLKTTKKPVESKKEEGSESPKKKPKILAIGVEGGFDVGEKRYEYEEANALVVLPEFVTVPLPNHSLPIVINLSIEQILKADSALKKEDVSIWMSEKRKVSKFAENLPQLDNGVKVPPKGWKCSKCDLTENLWLNLTDGAILCGRKNWDGTGGNGHALQHFQETQHPLCVKLGTISKEGAADVYSYAEDDMVEDPKIVEHLRHFGIDMEALQKTEKTIAELELDQNTNYEFNRLQESDKELVPLYGPGMTGMYNIGSSCYLSSVMQVLFTIPSFVDRYVRPAEEIFAASADPPNDFHVQMAKLGKDLLSGDYAIPDASKTLEFDGVSARSFKHLVGRGHPEFSTMKQQDAMEFFQYILDMADRKERAINPGQPSPSIAFKFKVEDRIECQVSHKVKYTHKVDNVLAVDVPMERATNQEAVRQFQEAAKNHPKPETLDKVRPVIPLLECLRAFASPELITDFYSSATKCKGPATKVSKLETFPRYLMIQVRKFTLGDDWVPRKLDIQLDVPDELDLTFLKGHGLQSGEEELPEEDEGAGPSSSGGAADNIDMSLVEQLVGMGFDVEGCKKAVFHTQNAGVEPAMNWVLEHMEDPDFTTPMAPKAGAAPKQKEEEKADPESIMMLESMGFSREHAILGLKNTGQNLERAADWLFSHAGELDTMAMETDAPAPAPNAGGSEVENMVLEGSPARYELAAFISHMGTNTSCGHYVCHIKMNGQWVLFNDSKVARSENPPKDLGYLFLYRLASSG